MKKLIEFFKKLFGCKQSCPKCKSNPCKCETEVRAEHKVELKELKTTDPFDIKEATYVSEFTTMPTNVDNHNLKDNDNTYCESVPDSKWECTSTATIDTAELNQNNCCKVESVPAKKKRIRKKKVMPTVEQEVPVVDSEVHTVEVPNTVEVIVEKQVEIKKKRSRKKKTESK